MGKEFFFQSEYAIRINMLKITTKYDTEKE